MCNSKAGSFSLTAVPVCRKMMAPISFSTAMESGEKYLSRRWQLTLKWALFFIAGMKRVISFFKTS